MSTLSTGHPNRWPFSLRVFPPGDGADRRHKYLRRVSRREGMSVCSCVPLIRRRAVFHNSPRRSKGRRRLEYVHLVSACTAPALSLLVAGRGLIASSSIDDFSLLAPRRYLLCIRQHTRRRGAFSQLEYTMKLSERFAREQAQDAQKRASALRYLGECLFGVAIICSVSWLVLKVIG